MTQINDIKTLSQFENDISGKSAVIHFWAEWAEQCTQMDSILNALLEVHEGKIYFGRCEAEECPEVSSKFEISAVPTVLLLKDGKEVSRINGIDPVQLSDSVEKLASGTLDVTPSKSSPKETLNEKLHRIIHKDAIVLFMKGIPQEPKCKFSRAVMALFKEVMPDLEFGHFNILEDEEVRQGIKEYSNWPTFPQLYIEGDLVGGLDVMKELNENGELIEMFENADKLKTKLKYVTKKSKLQLFMKGNPAEPKCGFSRKMIALLQEAGLDFGTFDILEDQEVREELKKFSNWPTYPQLYHKGTLIGGLDVCKEMHENGELAELGEE